jgi:plastocyanin
MLAAAEAPSKVPFYIAGGVLVAWALLVALWGITHADFPGSTGRARLVMLTSLALVALTVTMAVVTGGEAGKETPAAAAAGTPPPATGTTLKLAADPTGQLRYDTNRAAVKAGRVTVDFTNDSDVQHNVNIAEGSKTLGATKTIVKSTTSASISLAPGEYVYYCSIPGHRQAGMQGALTVE